MSGTIAQRRKAGGLLLVAALLAMLIGAFGCDSGASVNPLADVIVVLQDTLYSSRTLIPDSTYLLRGTVVVSPAPDAAEAPTLTIRPGTVVLGEKASRGRLVIDKGARIDAQGTLSSPIVFTSDQPVGGRTAGDWGGITIRGEAPSNDPGSGVGGDVEADSSGFLVFLRVEFAGGADDSCGIGLYGVGSATHVDYVQVHRSRGMGVRVQGGDVALTHLLITQPGVLGISWNLGWSGEGQFWIVQAAAGNGILGRNNPMSFSALPRSSPLLYNLTLVGNTGAAGVQLTSGTAGILRNSIVQGFRTAIRVEDNETASRALDSMLIVSHTIVFDCDSLAVSPDITVSGFNAAEWLADSSAVIRGTDPELTRPNSIEDPVFYPRSGSMAYVADSTAALPAESQHLGEATYAGAEYIWASWVGSSWTAFPRN